MAFVVVSLDMWLWNFVWREKSNWVQTAQSDILKVQTAKTFIQVAAFNFTHFESRITQLLYTAINTTEHG